MAEIKDMVDALKILIHTVKSAEGVSRFEFVESVETADKPTKYAARTVPTGWVNINLSIRLYDRSRDARQV